MLVIRNEAEQAWIAKAFLHDGGIYMKLNSSWPVVFDISMEFCDKWLGADVSMLIKPKLSYSDSMSMQWSQYYRLREYIYKALRNYSGDFKMPATIRRSDWNEARNEHAWMLRLEGETIQEISRRLSLSDQSVNKKIRQFAYRFSHAIRRVKLLTDKQSPLWFWEGEHQDATRGQPVP